MVWQWLWYEYDYGMETLEVIRKEGVLKIFIILYHIYFPHINLHILQRNILHQYLTNIYSKYTASIFLLIVNNKIYIGF